MSMRRLFVLPACLERALKNTIPEKITAECRGDDAIRALTRAGFFFIRQKGSHVRMKKLADR